MTGGGGAQIGVKVFRGRGDFMSEPSSGDSFEVEINDPSAPQRFSIPINSNLISNVDVSPLQTEDMILTGRSSISPEPRKFAEEVLKQ